MRISAATGSIRSAARATRAAAVPDETGTPHKCVFPYAGSVRTLSASQVITVMIDAWGGGWLGGRRWRLWRSLFELFRRLGRRILCSGWSDMGGFRHSAWGALHK